MRYGMLWLCMAAGGCATFVENRPRTFFLGQTYETGAVRDAVERAINHRRMKTQGGSGVSTFALSSRSGADCAYVVSYSDHNLVINIGPAGNPPPQPTQIDSRCVKEADLLGKMIEKEVQRPAKLAQKEQRRRER